MKKTALCLLLSILAAPMLVSAAPVTLSPKSPVIYKRITANQLSNGASGITNYSTQCSSRTISWSAGGSCTATIGTANNGGSLVVTPNSPATGSATFKCDGLDDRYVLQPGSSCTTTIASSTDACVSKSVSWDLCSATAPDTQHSVSTPNIVDSTAPSTGNARFMCVDGDFQYLSGGCSTTAPTCTSQSKTWSAGGNTCSALTGTTNNASSATVSNTNANGNVGSATYSCSAATNAYTIQGTPTCEIPPAQTCTTQVKTWTASGQTCSATVAQTNNGSTATATSTNGNIGTAQYTCAASTNTLTATGTPSCAAPTVILNNIVKIDSSARRTCALTSAGSVKCWGDWKYNREKTNTKPTVVPGLESGIKDITIGSRLACAITTAGAVKCWDSEFPPQVINGMEVGVRKISLGYQVCGVTLGKTLICSLTTEYNGRSGVEDVFVSGRHGCVLYTGGYVTCFGQNHYGQAPAQPINTGAIALFSSGGTGDHSCAIMSNGDVKCWGRNDQYQSGTPSIDITKNPSGIVTPRRVENLTDNNTIKSLIPGNYRTCALTTDDKLYCWGIDSGLTSNDPVPRVKAIDVKSVSLGIVDSDNVYDDAQTCIAKTDGSAHCFGMQYLGDGTANGSSAFVKVISSGVKSITARNDRNGSDGFNGHTCALMESGSVKCWGTNIYGELGHGDNATRMSPVDVVD